MEHEGQARGAGRSGSEVNERARELYALGVRRGRMTGWPVSTNCDFHWLAQERGGETCLEQGEEAEFRRGLSDGAAQADEETRELAAKHAENADYNFQRAMDRAFHNL